jgi:hypothetical protein
VYIVVPTNTIAVKLRNDLVKKDMQQEMAVRDSRTLLHTLMGEDGVQGSLDILSYEIVVDDDEKVIDTLLQAA